MPAELDEVRRRMMQLEIEREGLRKEKDPASQERLGRIEQELADLKEQATELEARWQRELDELNKVGQLQEKLDAARNAARAGLAARRLGAAARLKYEIGQLEQQLARGDRGAARAQRRTAARWSRRRSTSRTSPTWSAAGPASRSAS